MSRPEKRHPLTGNDRNMKNVQLGRTVSYTPDDVSTDDNKTLKAFFLRYLQYLYLH